MKKFLGMFTLLGLVIFGCNFSYARDGITYNDNLTTWTDLNGNSFNYGTITIEHNGKTITMMDRNLGATTNNTNSNRSFGYYYQRGNNYGFSSNFDLLRTGENPVDASSYGPGNYYSRAIYTVSPRNQIYDGDRSTVRNDNLWGGSGDNFDNNYLGYPVQNPTDRQGPCPDGYHVPSMGERLKVIEWRALNNNGAGYGNVLDYTNNFGRPGLSGGISRFRSDFFIPESKSFATNWFEYDEGYSISENLNFLRSSSSIPYTSGYCDLDGCISYNTDYRDSRALYFYTPRSSSVGERRDLAAPVRCFKNPDNSIVDEDISFSIDIDSTTNIGKTEFEVKVMKDGATFRDYTGTVYLYLTDKYGNTTDNDIYAFSDGKSYEFKKNDHGKKAFSVKIEEEGTYVLRINDLSNDDIKGSETITVKGNSNNSNFEYDYSKFNPYYSDEMNKAYQYAYHYGITTINNINNANMNGSLNRIAMAKMLSYFAENVLGMDDFDTRRNCEFNDVPSYLDRQYNYGVTKACQLGIMGINMQNNNFNPYGTVTRAQFATALSRLLYGTKDGTYNYYSTHISKLYKEGIISNTNPNLQEKRGYVMLMLMRSQDDGSTSNNNSSTTYHSPNMIDMSNLLFGLSSSDPELTCNRTEKVYREDGRYYRYKSDGKWTADARFVNNILQTVRNSGQYLVEDYIRQANDVLDSVGLINENRCRYSFLIYALENQRGELTSYKTQNGITTIGVDFYSYKETLGEYDIDPAGGTYLIYKNTSKKSRNYRLSENPQLEILKVDSNGHTNAVYYFDGPETRSYVSNWNTWINTYCNNEVVYNGKSPDPDSNLYNYNWNTNNALCIKNRLSNPGENPLTFTFDDLGNISKIGGFYYWLAFHS